MSKSLRLETDPTFESAFGLIPSAEAKFSIWSAGYEVAEVQADVLIPDRDDVRRYQLAPASYALRHGERIRRRIEDSGEWPSKVHVLRHKPGPTAAIQYRPLEDDRLLDEFLDLRNATVGFSRLEAVRRFADRHGFLGLPVVVSVGGHQQRVELLAEWSEQIERLADRKELWERLSQSRLGREHWGHLEGLNALRARFGPRHLDELQTLGNEELHRSINDHLRGEVEVEISAAGRLIWAPSSLLAVIYLHFASRVLGSRPRTRACKWCGRPISPDESRKRQFCKDSCRSKYHRAMHRREKT